MPSEPLARRRWSAKLTAAAALGLAALSGCASGPPRPTTPAYSGVMRPEPSRPARPDDPLPSEPVSSRYAESRSAYQPRHMPREQAQSVKRVAVLLPFSSTDAETRRVTNGLYNAIQLALFESQAQDVILMPRDTGASSDAQAAARVAEEAVRDGAVAVIGPLFAQQVGPVAGEAAEVRAPVFAFSTDISAAGQGAYLVSLTPRSEVERIVDWAASQGVTRYAVLAPNSTYGRRVEGALREEVAERGGAVVAAEFYNPGDSSPQEPARRVGSVIKSEIAANPGKVGVLIPEGGVQLRTVASLLPYLGEFNLRDVKFMGTGLWNDADVWRESALRGGAFPAPDPEAVAEFERRYRATFGESPPRLASYGYDAGAIAARLASMDRLDAAMIQRESGWSAANGLFRFTPDGSVERALAVMQLQDGTAAIVAPPAKSFTGS